MYVRLLGSILILFIILILIISIYFLICKSRPQPVKSDNIVDYARKMINWTIKGKNQAGKRTLFAHVLNEEILLPSWLHHHKKLFTDGIILDCQSSDNTVNIIQTICPHWKIISITNSADVANLDLIMMQQLESEITGWKMVLNVSEYLIVNNLEQYLEKFERSNPDAVGFKVTGVILVDEPGDHDIKQFQDVNFIMRKNFGYIEAGKAWNGHIINETFPTTTQTFRNRLIHKSKHGAYKSGRHDTYHNVSIDENIYVAWLGRGSPELYLHKNTIWRAPPLGISIWGSPDVLTPWTPELMYKFWETERAKSSNLFELLPLYKEYIHALYPIL